MYINNVKVYGLNESKVAAGYPMRVDVDENNSIEDDIFNEKFPEAIDSLGQSKPGTGHANFLKGIIVQFNLNFSIKAWYEAERYNWFDFVSSTSLMHRITKMDIKKSCNKYVWGSTITTLEKKVKEYNEYAANIAYMKKHGLHTSNFHQEDYNRRVEHAKELYLEILYNVPAGFEFTARMTTNYLQLKTIYAQRRNHRLPDWQHFCDWIETLPDSHFITGKRG